MRDSVEDISVRALKIALADMPETFHTKDLSNHEAMQHSHAAWMAERDTRYHQMVGMYLSWHRQELDIEKISDSTSDALWRKRPASRQ